MNRNYFHTIYELICAGHWLTDQVSIVLKEDKITEPQYNVLKILQAADGQAVSVQHIQAGMVQKSSNVTRIVDKLIARAYVHRQECPSNRRKMDITLTDEGQDALKVLDKKVMGIHESMMNRLSREELKSLRDLIKKLTNEQSR